MTSEIDVEAQQSRRMQELAQQLIKECPMTWRWGDGDGGAIINAIFRASEEAGLRKEPQPHNHRCNCGNHDESGEEGQILYRFYNRSGELLYIGITDNPFARWARHSKDKTWFPEVARFETDWFPDRPSVIAAERHAITTEKPKYNIIYSAPGGEKYDHQ